MKSVYFSAFCLITLWAAPGAHAIYHEKLPPEVLSAPVARPTLQELEAQQRSARQVPTATSGQGGRDEAVTLKTPPGPPLEPALAPAPKTEIPEEAARPEAKPTPQAETPSEPRPQPWSSRIGQALLVAVALFFVMTMYGLFRSEREKRGKEAER
ncbi:MAG: hypothetical protein IT210_16305 [Armatimonadetes bacterium]|nr:hypothetical protein [Armatimonadota bacterium]